MFKTKYMRVDFDKTFLFHDIDRHGTVKNAISGLLVDDFTMMISFLPDWDSIDRVLERRKNNPKFDVTYHQTCIIETENTLVYFSLLILIKKVILNI